MARRTLRSSRAARKERTKRTKTLLLLFVVVLGLAGVAIYALSRPLFRIQRVELIGATRIPEQSIRMLLAQHLSGAYFGVIPRAHILFYPRAAIRNALFLRFPSLSHASLSLKNFAALQVSVREREPEALWCIAEHVCFQMDRTGFVFEEAGAAREDQYYRLEGTATTSPIGRTVIESEELADLLAFLKGLERLSLEPRWVKFEDAHEEMSVMLSGGLRLLLMKGAYAKALESMRVLLKNEAIPKVGSELSVSYIDLRYGNRVYFKSR
jgi:cell division septal protein FtsQ